jgi:hypothetical protein
MAVLLRDVIDAGAPPSMAQLPMTPEEVAASYEAAGDEPPDTGDDRTGGERGTTSRETPTLPITTADTSSRVARPADGRPAAR